MNARDGIPPHAIEQHQIRTALTVAQLNIVLLQKRLHRQESIDAHEAITILRRVERAHKVLINQLSEPKHPDGEFAIAGLSE